MKLLLLLLCATASAAPLPPVPRLAQSPRAASVPKSTPMTRVETVPPTTGKLTWAVTRHINFFNCDTNSAGCVLYNNEHVTAPQPMGIGILVQFAGTPDAEDWYTVGTFYPPPFDVVTEATFYYPEDQEPVARFYRAIEWTPEGFTPAMFKTFSVAKIEPVANPALLGCRAWVRKK